MSVVSAQRGTVSQAYQDQLGAYSVHAYGGITDQEHPSVCTVQSSWTSTHGEEKTWAKVMRIFICPRTFCRYRLLNMPPLAGWAAGRVLTLCPCRVGGSVLLGYGRDVYLSINDEHPAKHLNPQQTDARGVDGKTDGRTDGRTPGCFAWLPSRSERYAVAHRPIETGIHTHNVECRKLTRAAN